MHDLLKFLWEDTGRFFIWEILLVTAFNCTVLHKQKCWKFTAPDCISHVTRHISYDAYAEYRIYSKCGVNSDNSSQNFENLWWNIFHWGQYTWKTRASIQNKCGSEASWSKTMLLTVPIVHVGEPDPTFSLISGEPWFHLSGYVKSQNNRLSMLNHYSWCLVCYKCTMMAVFNTPTSIPTPFTVNMLWQMDVKTYELLRHLVHYSDSCCAVTHTVPK